jgi:hypothetical protein
MKAHEDSIDEIYQKLGQGDSIVRPSDYQISHNSPVNIGQFHRQIPQGCQNPNGRVCDEDYPSKIRQKRSVC